MKQFVDIHTLLSTPEDMEDIHDDSEEASDKLNLILHMVFDRIEEDEETDRINNILSKTWEHWHQDRYLLDIEVDDLVDWVDHLLSTWDDSEES
ncbi:hypothetical protein ISG33_05140 [Glaciecola sp. MH2013]|uniref:hypothetical protein n=1 Tax=Glaciecola sp. MH2013 TaxID=2785524 RepID=UPI00189DF40A|nr:hypothetical protein [Glaciecola sp. MH2013]MBF7072785.1 hypothetical protein [Glaciecola sp. MH2013]